MNIQYAPNFRTSIFSRQVLAFEIRSHFCHQGQILRTKVLKMFNSF